MKGPFAIRKLGFTGARNGLSEKQAGWLATYLKANPPDKAAHGDCVGADAEFHDLVRWVCPNCKIHIWPSLSESLRAYKKGDVLYEPMKALDRDKLIVKFCNVFVGCPPTDYEITRSGSWATLRMARNRFRKDSIRELYLVYPNAAAVEGDWR